MPPIYHLFPAGSWNSDNSDSYFAQMLVAEGFIHCSLSNQVARTANRHFADEPELFAMEIDANRVTSRLAYEGDGMGELFPHVYGPIDRGAIVAIHHLARDAGGKWIWPLDAGGN